MVENTGVAAYAGAGPFIESPDLQSATLAIHSVEARHAAILNWIDRDSPFPNAFEFAGSLRDVLDGVTLFFASETGDGADRTETPAGNETATGTPVGNESA